MAPSCLLSRLTGPLSPKKKKCPWGTLKGPKSLAATRLPGGGGEDFAVDPDHAVADLYGVAGETHQPLHDERASLWHPQDHDLSTAQVGLAQEQPVHQEVVLILQGGAHAQPRDLKRLKDEVKQKDGEGERQAEGEECVTNARQGGPCSHGSSAHVNIVPPKRWRGNVAWADEG